MPVGKYSRGAVFCIKAESFQVDQIDSVALANVWLEDCLSAGIPLKTIKYKLSGMVGKTLLCNPVCCWKSTEESDPCPADWY